MLLREMLLPQYYWLTLSAVTYSSSLWRIVKYILSSFHTWRFLYQKNLLVFSFTGVYEVVLVGNTYTNRAKYDSAYVLWSKRSTPVIEKQQYYVASGLHWKWLRFKDELTFSCRKSTFIPGNRLTKLNGAIHIDTILELTMHIGGSNGGIQSSHSFWSPYFRTGPWICTQTFKSRGLVKL